jgi:mono/diheme cytochrome c family protein
VSARVRTPTSKLARFGAATAVTTVMALAAVSCGGGADDTQSGAIADRESSTVDGSPATAGVDPVVGEQLSRSSGCAGCHGQNFDGGAGPGWIGLAGSERMLADGTTVVADTDYLIRAIAEPSAGSRCRLLTPDAGQQSVGCGDRRHRRLHRDALR